MLDPTVAKALFAVVISAAQGPERVQLQLPLQVVDRGAHWLVKGTPYTNRVTGTRFCMCYIFFDKRTARIDGIDCVGRIPLSKKTKADLAKVITPEQLASLTRPPMRFEPHPIAEVWLVLSGGLVPTEAAAVDYAALLLKSSSKWAALAPSSLTATERDGLWHVARRTEPYHEVATIARRDGSLLFGDF